MIFAFHMTVQLIQNALSLLFKSKYSNRNDVWDSKLWYPGETFFIDDDPKLHFMPACYIQRYATVCNILTHEQNYGSISKVADLGCAELGLFLHLKNVEGLEDYVGVDIDLDLLKRYSCKIEPQMSDCLYGVRKKPLTARVYCGSATDYDSCLEGTDAVICVELIEHLHADVLDRVPENVFRRIQPRIAIFTTPNCEFNVLFSNFSGMRHPDHKFEWTRQEFQTWAVNIVKKFPEYSVKLHGICPPPENRESVGCCSQMAVFRKEVDLKLKMNSDNSKSYELIHKVEYPFTKDEYTETEKVVQEVRYRYFRLASIWEENDSNSDRDGVPLEQFLPFVTKFCSTVDELREILETEGWKVGGTKDEPFITLPEEDSDTFASEGCLSGNNSVIANFEECWSDDANEVLCEEQINGGNATKPCDSSICIDEESTCGGASAAENCINSSSLKKSCNLVQNESEAEAYSPIEVAGEEDWFSADAGGTFTAKIGHLNGAHKTPPSDRSWGQVSSVEVARYESDESDGEIATSSWRTRRQAHARNGRGTSRLAKSFSLDSCLENINCERAEVQAMYLSMHSRARTLESGSPSERGLDSGYPISFSQDLSEQPDLATSEDSLSEGEDVPLRLPRLLNPVPLVENGDVANNNRDGEGNNVEGVQNPLPPPFRQEEFPPWLLHLLMDPLPFPPPDEGLGEDSGSELSDSPAGSVD